ncbi:MAG: DNA topoisomerase [Sulfurimonas sp.]|uniref:DNA topoisomerase n=1 Tax=Sulfurimonas sp. TaxID=2022749 RepID=UPI00260E9728|nr:DNA topoisomerase [Sulfurimonas sp.]MDD5373357.1 DNA topoisomerase [Sulfurimonas sp.]
MKTLILTEKVDAGCQVAEALYNIGIKEGDFGSSASLIKKSHGKKGFLVGGDYTVVWTNGHLGVDMSPSVLNETYALKFGFIEGFDYSMPLLRKEMKRGVKKDRIPLAKLIKDLIKNGGFERCFVCTDGDAEGERIAHDALVVFGSLGKSVDVRRMWVTGAFNTVKVIKEQLETALPWSHEKYTRLLDSQRARSVGDYLQGMKSTKILVDIYGAKLYSGRVKNTIIGMIGDRELEIKNFSPKKYFTIKGVFGGISLAHFFMKEVEDVDKSGKLVSKLERSTLYFSKSDKDRVLAEIEAVGRRGVVTRFTKTLSRSKGRPLPLSGDDFKSEMAKKYKLSLEESGKILQYLRDEGFTTYQGTNGRYFSRDEEVIVAIAYKTALAVFNGDENIKSASFGLEAGLFDDAKAKKQNHPPLHLTERIPTVADYEKWASSSIKRVKEGYELIAKRILVHFLEEDSFESIKLEIDIASHLFDASGVKPIKQGWRVFVGEEKKDDSFSLNVNQGDSVRLDDLSIEEKETTKPKLYSEGEVLATLMNVSRVLNEKIDEEDDPQKKLRLKQAKNILKNVEGIGTDRTREMILKELGENGLLNYKKEITLTKEGWILYEALPEPLRSILYTAVWEEDFEKIRRGELCYDDFISKVEDGLKGVIEYIISHVNKDKRAMVSVAREVIKTSLVCPLCGNWVVDSGAVFKCEKQKFKNNKQSGCPFGILKTQKLLAAKFNEKLVGRLLAGEVLSAPNGNKICLDLESKFFTRIEFAVGFNGEELSGSESDGVVETAKTFRLGGKFCFKEAFGKKLTKAEATKILQGQEIKLKRVSKAGKPYEITVWLEEGGKFGSGF